MKSASHRLSPRRVLRHALSLLAIVTTFAPAASGAALELPEPPAISTPVWLVAEAGSRQILAGKDIDARIDPASLTKIATAYVTLRAIADGEIKAETRVTAPPEITQRRGSRMYLEPGHEVSIDELLFGLIVPSGNDAAFLLATTVAGSEAAFVERLNALAKRLGLSGTRFANAEGWGGETHYSTARDLATLTAALIEDFPEAYGRYFATRRHGWNGIEQLNRNRLLWIDATVDGVKTGRSRSAGQNLIASSRRGERRLIAVVLAAADDDQRINEALALLNWGYLSFDGLPLYPQGREVARLRLWYGAANEVAVGFPGRNFSIAVPRGMAGELRAQLVSGEPLHAPIAEGQALGTLRFTLAGEPWGEYPVYSLETVPRASVFGRIADAVRLWLRDAPPATERTP